MCVFIYETGDIMLQTEAHLKRHFNNYFTAFLSLYATEED